LLNAQTEYRIKLLDAQDRFIFSSAKYSAFIGGVGSGKTWAGCVNSLIHCHNDVFGAIVAPTYPMLRDVTQATLLTILDEAEQVYTHVKSENILYYQGTTIYLRSADQPDRLRGLNLDWAYLDEAALMREMTWRVILGRLRRGEPRAWITTTPAGYNWVYRYWQERKDANYAMIRASTRDNTYLPSEYVRDLLDTYTGEFARQEIEGEFVAFEGLVYNFRYDVHVVEPFDIPEDWTIVRGIDFGYTNPFVCLWGAIDEDGRLYIIDEHYQRKTLIKDHAEAIKGRPWKKALWTVADHDAQGNAELWENGVDTINAQKAVIDGIQKVAARLEIAGDGRPRLYVMSNCVNLIKEFGIYRWVDSKEGRNEKEEPVKEADHAMDALRYMVMELDNSRAPKVRFV